MRCADCGLYECAMRSPLGGCLNGQAGEHTVIFTAPDTKPYNFGNGLWDKGYEPAAIPKEKMEEIKKAWLEQLDLYHAASDLVDAVERYTKPEKGQFCHRSELLNVKDRLKKLISNV